MNTRGSTSDSWDWAANHHTFWPSQSPAYSGIPHASSRFYQFITEGCNVSQEIFLAGTPLLGWFLYLYLKSRGWKKVFFSHLWSHIYYDGRLVHLKIQNS